MSTANEQGGLGRLVRRSVAPFVTVLVMAGLIGVLVTHVSTRAAEAPVVIPPPTEDMAAGDGLQTLVLAGGCFWGVQAVYQHMRGVTQALSGYAGDTAETATYKLVSAGRTRHAEAVQIRFDPTQVSYGTILQVFFSVVHDPTQLNRQGPDIGPHYRSAIFYQSAAEKEMAEKYIAQLDRTGLFGKPIVTTLEPLQAFYRAEDYHQDYYHTHPRQLYIVVHDRPKVENLKKIFPAIYADDPMTVAKSGG